MRRVSIFIGIFLFLISGSPPAIAADVLTLEKSIETVSYTHLTLPTILLV